MKFYNEKEKKIIGNYFRYIRKVREIKLRNIYEQNMCGHSTYHDIEKGIVKWNDEYYDLLLNYYHIHYSISTKYLDILFNWIEDIYNNVQKYEIEQLKQRIIWFKEKYRNFQKHIYIRELYTSVDYIYNFYSENQLLNQQQIRDLIPIIELFENKYGSILLEVCEHSNHYSIFDCKIADKLALYLNNADLIREYWFTKRMCQNGNRIKSIQLMNKLLSEMKNNVIRETYLLIDLHSIYRDIDLLKTEEFRILLEKRVTTLQLPLEVKVNIYNELGMNEYFNYSYEKAIEYYRKGIKNKPNILSIIFLSSSLSHLHLNLDPVFEFQVDSQHSLYFYYLFYKKKYMKENNNKLEDYILNEIINKLKKEPLNLYWNMFEYEMRILNSKTINYKKLNVYIKLRDKYLKSGN